MSKKSLVLAAILGLTAAVLAVTVYVRTGPHPRSVTVVVDGSAHHLKLASKGGLPCPATTTAKAVIRFIAAVNSGDRSALTSIFDDPRFRWYSVALPRHFVAYKSSEATAYIAERLPNGERLSLVRLTVGDDNTFEGVSAITFTVEHRRGGSSAARYDGKGTVACGSGRIIAWSLGADSL